MINIGCPRKGFYFPIGLLTAILVLVVGICVAPFAAIADPPGGQTELIAIERICKRLLCNQLQSKRWRELVPYLRDPNALDKVQVICSGGGCGGTLQLRDGIELRFGYPYVPAKSNGEQDDTVNDIQLWKDGKNIRHFTRIDWENVEETIIGAERRGRDNELTQSGILFMSSVVTKVGRAHSEAPLLRIQAHLTHIKASRTPPNIPTVATEPSLVSVS